MNGAWIEIEVVDADERAAEGCEMVLVLGGDGTFLRAAELARNVEIPVLGVNLGHIGFLAEAEAEAIDSVLDHVIKRNYRVEERMTLDIAVRVDGHVIHRGWALNEASLEKGPRLGVLGVVLEVDGRPVSSFGCDGVLGLHADGIDGLRVLRGRSHPVARPRIDPGRAQQCSRPVRAPDGDQPELLHRHRGRGERVRRDGVLRRPSGNGRPGRCAARGGTLRHAVEVDPARQRAVHRRLVRKFRLPVTGWRGQ